MSTSNVSLDTKRHSIIMLVSSLVEDRIKNIYARTTEHHKTILAEVFHHDAIVGINTTNELLVANLDLINLTMDRLGNLYNLSDVRSGELALTPFSVIEHNENAPYFAINTGDGVMNAKLNDFFDEVWEAEAKKNPTRVVLSTPIKIFSDKNVTDSSCTIDDDGRDPNTLFVDVDDYIPSEDCTTRREFDKAVKEIGSDAAKLAKEIFASIRPCRSETAILKIVPELEPFICSEAATEVGRGANISSLIQRVANK